METKVCNTCGEEKPITEFHLYRRKKEGREYRQHNRQSNCKKCSSKINAENYQISSMKKKLRQRIKLILENDFVKSKKEYVDIATGQKERNEKI